MRGNIKTDLFTFVFIILLLPLTQQVFPVFTSGVLYGYSDSPPNVEFSWADWWEAKYQQQNTRFLNDNTGFRPDLVRLTNQLNYSLFHATHAWNIIEGSNHNLFLATSIDGYYGTDYAGYDAIHEKMRKLKAISDTLGRLGKSIILVHAPAKVFLFPEDIPEIRTHQPRTATNLETFIRIADSMKINQVDFNTWFCKMRDTSKELIFPHQGGHWSVYSSYLAADSLIRFIEKLRNIRMPHPAWTKILHTSKPRDPDDDIAKTLNLIYPITKEVFSYPEVSYTQDATMVKPKIIYIGDSFLLSWMRDGIMDNTNTDWQIWQWFSILWNKNSDKNKADGRVQDTDWIASINNTDCIVIMYTSFNLPALGNGFVEQAYDHYYPKK
jgi:acetyltransferase AlgX (SGNH hydrolase-like protein)